MACNNNPMEEGVRSMVIFVLKACIPLIVQYEVGLSKLVSRSLDLQ